MPHGIPVLTPARKFLNEQGVTVRQIERDTGLSYAVLANIVNGRTLPRGAAAKSLARYLGVTLEELS